jgi:hypothetical protein
VFKWCYKKREMDGFFAVTCTEEAKGEHREKRR